MPARSSKSWTEPAIRVAAAGFGAAVAGPLGGALGGWLGAALGGPAADLIEKCAERFGDSAAEKLLDVGADSLVERLKKSAPDLVSAYRDALRQSLIEVHNMVADFDDWFANWDLCLASSMPLALPASHLELLTTEKLDGLFLNTLERLDAQGIAIRQKTLSLELKCRVIPETLLSELNERLPQYLRENIHATLVKPDYEEGWKQAQLVFQVYVDTTLGRIDEATREIDRKTDVLPRMAEDVANLLKMAETEQRTIGLHPIPELIEGFLGRDDDLEKILERICSHRVVTVTGLGGIGKSEIAKAVARAVGGQDWTADGVFYVDLSGATDASLVKGTIISNLGLDPNKPFTNQLAGRRLYVLDDLYQALVTDRKGVQDIVRSLYDSAAPSHFLLTSREPVGVVGAENLCSLGRLLPPHDGDLFRTLAEGIGYRWQDGDTERLTGLLEQLDGYPLAIVIAANRLRDELLESLVRRWKNRHTEALNLPGISSSELSKMTSVDFSMTLSFNHLPEGSVRDLFALFADLPAGATHRMLEAIVGDDVDDFLAYLIRGSLVQKQDDRFAMLVPVREFASKRRTEASSKLRQMLDSDLIAFAEQWCSTSVWNTSRKTEAVSALSSEELNFHAAVNRGKARGDNNFLVGLISPLSCFLATFVSISKEMLLDGVNAARAIGQALPEANYLRSLGDVYRMDNGCLESAHECYKEALILYQQISNKSGEASCLEAFGDLYTFNSKDELARQRYDQAALVYRSEDKKLGEANCLRKIAAMEADSSEQLKGFEAALALFRDGGDELGKANCLKNIAEIYLDLDNYTRVQELLEQALPLFRKLEDKPREGNSLRLLAQSYMRTDQYASAAKELEEARKVFTAMGDTLGKGFCQASADEIRERIAEFITAYTSRANSVRLLGDLYVILDENEQAKSCYRDALTLCQEHLNEDDEPHCRKMLGTLTDDYQDALGHYEAALSLYMRSGNQSETADVLHKSAKLHIRHEQYELARGCFQEALDLYKSTSDTLGQAECLRGLSDVYLGDHQNDKAMQTYNEALKLYEATDPSDTLANTYWDIGNEYIEGPRTGEAISWMEKAERLYESIGDADQAQQARNKVEEWRQGMKDSTS